MKHQRLNVLTIVLLGLLVGSCGHTQTPAPRPDFNAALKAHLTAIERRDLNEFRATLTRGDELMVIFPGGQALPNTSEVISFHRDWFADTAWRFSPEVVKVIEGADQSTALLRYEYRDAPDGAPRFSWLVLVFALEDGQWRLVHDQNTRIETPTS